MVRRIGVVSLLLSLVAWGCPGEPPDDDDAGDSGGSGDSGDDDSGDDDDSSDPGPPNILIVIADDFGLDLASFDQSAPCFAVGDTSNDPALPTLARLCQDGIRFTRAWATPTCSPTRASLLTGTLPSRHGVGGPVGANNGLALTATTLPGLLEGTGYARANIGKWHVSQGESDPAALGWDYYAGSLSGALGSYSSWDQTEQGATTPATGYLTSRTVDDALGWLGGVTAQPWLLWLAFNAPHTPLHVPPSELHGYSLVDPPDTGGFDAQPYVAAMSQAMDTELGRLVAWLEAEGEWDNTVVFFFGDNGTVGRAADAPWGQGTAKGSLREGGVAVPLVIAGAGVSGGRAIQDVVSVIDVFATALELAGVEAPVGDAVSLVPYLAGTAEAVRDVVMTEQFGGVGGSGQAEEGKAITNGAHKLICDDDGAVLLFDLGGAYEETVDLYEEGVGAGALQATYEELRDRLRAELGDASLCE